METNGRQPLFDKGGSALELASLAHRLRRYRKRNIRSSSLLTIAVHGRDNPCGKVTGRPRRQRDRRSLGRRSQRRAEAPDGLTPARITLIVAAVLLGDQLLSKLHAHRSSSAGATGYKTRVPASQRVPVLEQTRLGLFGRLGRFFREWALACTVSSLMLPGAIAAATVLLFLTGSNAGRAHSQWSTALNRTDARVCFFGAVVGVVFCILLAAFACRRFTRAESACPEPHDELRERFDDLKARLEVISVRASDVAPDQSLPEADWRLAAHREACDHLAYLAQYFGQPSPVGLRWLLATGYLDAWRRLHTVEQSLLALEPEPRVLRESLHDELRLDGSTIPQSAALLKRLRAAVVTLDPAAAAYLIAAPAASKLSDKAGARAVISQVRAAISEFRDSRREGLVRARNRLFGTVIFVGMTGCLVLFIAILGGATKSEIEAGAAFYLVGALVGLVKQLQSAATGGSAAQTDYGLGVVRLIQTPQFSGLAAIGGVVLFRLAQGQGSGTGGGAPFSLQATFDLGSNPYGLVAAAVFGLTPALLFSGLRQRVEQYRTDLSESSNQAESSPKAPGSPS
jgi:hypothetical protein